MGVCLPGEFGVSEEPESSLYRLEERDELPGLERGLFRIFMARVTDAGGILTSLDLGLLMEGFYANPTFNNGLGK